MKIQCEYCKNWIEDTTDKCPYCGASNDNLKRYADTAPKTIAELQEWYKARNLPPENVTRFFIGKNYKGARAFGIYQDGDNFIVYKNKANGSRAVRYNGPDEAYAVNELYLRLKEEILNQKSRNIAERAGGDLRHYSNPGSSRSSEGFPRQDADDTDIARIWNGVSRIRDRQNRGGIFRKFKNIFLRTVMLIVILVVGIAEVFLVMFQHQEDYYAASSDPVYYREYKSEWVSKEWEWWIYSDGEWSWLKNTKSKNELPDGISSKDRYKNEEKLEEALGIDIPSPGSSHAYLDRHPQVPDDSYYYYDDTLWYYAKDSYGPSYGKDRNGWYYYDEDETDWNYYAKYYDREQIPEDLYYDNWDYELTDDYDELKSDYAYMFPAGFIWSQTCDFTTTDYYKDIQDSTERHQDEESKNSKDDDSDWDWDSNDSWDSGATDWDSDW